MPRAFADKPPAGLPKRVLPACPRGGLQPIRSPSASLTGKLILTMIMPWYGVPALLHRDPLLEMPSGSVRVRVTDPYAGRDSPGAWVAAIREDGDRFLEQVNSGGTLRLPQGRYRMQAALSSAPLRWGARSIDVKAGDALDTEIALDQVAPDFAPIVPAGAIAAASRVSLAWTGEAPDGVAVVVRVGAKGVGRPDYTDVRGRDGHVGLDVGGTPGAHVATYLLCAPLVPVAQWALDVGPSDAALDLPPQVRGGEPVAMTARGSFPLAAQYQITETGGEHRIYASGFVAAGETIVFAAPLSGGEFEATLIAHDGTTLLQRRISVTPVPVSIVAPASTVFRQPVALGWRTPAATKLQLQALPMLPAGWPSFYPTDTSTDPGPVERLWRIPPGKVAIRIADEAHPSFAIAEAIVDVTGGPAFIAPPAAGKAGASIEVAFTVPARDGDRLAAVQRDYTTLQYAVPTALAAGARRGTIVLPAAPGDYDLVYATMEGAGPDDNQMILSARTPITVE